MNDIATHLRVTGLQYDNSDVDARRGAVATLKTAWAKQTQVPLILGKAEQIIDALTTGVPAEALGLEIQAAVQKKASAFLYEDRPLEVGIVAAVAAQQVVSGDGKGLDGWMIADVWAMALWSGLSFQLPLEDPKREALRSQLCQTARDRAIDGAEYARQRVDVAEIPSEAEGDTTKLQGAVKGAVEALRRNSALDREELDFLWWALADRSRVLNRQLVSLGEPTRLVAAAIDASALLRRLPCQVHRELLLRNLDADPELTLKELVDQLGDERAPLVQSLGNSVPDAPGVFPVLTAMSDSEVNDSAVYRVKRKTSEWAQRVLVEAAMCRIKEAGPKKK